MDGLENTNELPRPVKKYIYRQHSLTRDKRREKIMAKLGDFALERLENIVDDCLESNTKMSRREILSFVVAMEKIRRVQERLNITRKSKKRTYKDYRSNVEDLHGIAKTVVSLRADDKDGKQTDDE